MRAPTTRAPRSAASGPYGRLMRSYKVQSLFPTVVGVETSERVAALTFDDGPDPEWTPRVLDTLARHGARGTFFLLGRNVDAAPDIARRVVDEGHAIGNHSYSHPCLADCHPLTVARELRKCQRAIRHATGQTTHLMRPPYGAQMVDTYLTARTLGYEVVNWSVSSDDWLGDPAPAIARRVLDAVIPGSIILMHDSWLPPPAGHGPAGDPRQLADRRPTIDALPIIIERLQESGYRFVTVADLLRTGPTKRMRWFWE